MRSLFFEDSKLKSYPNNETSNKNEEVIKKVERKNMESIFNITLMGRQDSLREKYFVSFQDDSLYHTITQYLSYKSFNKEGKYVNYYSNHISFHTTLTNEILLIVPKGFSHLRSDYNIVVVNNMDESAIPKIKCILELYRDVVIFFSSLKKKTFPLTTISF